MKNTAKRFSSFTGVLSLGLTNGVCIVLGFVIGFKLDQYFHSDPWGSVIGLCIGFLSGLVENYRQIKIGIEELDNEKRAK